MFNIRVLAGFANGVAQAAAAKQAQAPQQQRKGKRKMKGSGCTPCAGIARVDSTRQRMGFSVK